MKNWTSSPVWEILSHWTLGLHPPSSKESTSVRLDPLVYVLPQKPQVTCISTMSLPSVHTCVCVRVCVCRGLFASLSKSGVCVTRWPLPSKVPQGTVPVSQTCPFSGWEMLPSFLLQLLPSHPLHTLPLVRQHSIIPPKMCFHKTKARKGRMASGCLATAACSSGSPSNTKASGNRTNAPTPGFLPRWGPVCRRKSKRVGIAPPPPLFLIL